MTLIAAGLSVPAVTFASLWFWRLRPGRRADLRPSTEAALAYRTARAYARQQELQAQVEALGRGFEERDRRLAAQVIGLIGTATKAARIVPDTAANRHGRRDGIGEGGRGGA